MRKVSSEFFDLRATHNPHRWFLPVADEVTVGHTVQAFLFGGVGMAGTSRSPDAARAAWRFGSGPRTVIRSMRPSWRSNQGPRTSP